MMRGMRLAVLVLAFVLQLAGCRDEARAPAAPLDLNRATVAELEKLPGIGDKRARSIMASRNARGGHFVRLEDLLEIDGIGEGTLAKLRPLVIVGPARD